MPRSAHRRADRGIGPGGGGRRKCIPTCARLFGRSGGDAPVREALSSEKDGRTRLLEGSDSLDAWESGSGTAESATSDPTPTDDASAPASEHATRTFRYGPPAGGGDGERRGPVPGNVSPPRTSGIPPRRSAECRFAALQQSDQRVDLSVVRAELATVRPGSGVGDSADLGADHAHRPGRYPAGQRLVRSDRCRPLGRRAQFLSEPYRRRTCCAAPGPLPRIARQLTISRTRSGL